MTVTVGGGLTVTVAVAGVPFTAPAVGVTVNVTVIGAFVVLVREPLILPDPLAEMPVTVPVLLRTQLYVVPETGLPLLTIVVIAEPEAIVCADGVQTTDGVAAAVVVNVPTMPP